MVKTKKEKKKKPSALKKYLILFCIGAIIASLLSYRLILTGIGEYLIFAQSPEKVDLIVTLIGDDIPRGLTAVEMYKAGYAGRVFRGREELPEGYDTFIALGGKYIEPRDNFRKMLRSLGVGVPAFFTDDTEIEGSYEEAEVIRDFLRKNNFKSVMIITSKPDSRRTYLTYKLLLEDDKVNIVICPTKYDEFDPETWWKVRREAKRVLYEYERLPICLLRYGLWKVLF